VTNYKLVKLIVDRIEQAIIAKACLYCISKILGVLGPLLAWIFS
jgi:hypothetical protein